MPRDDIDEVEAELHYAETDPTGRYGRFEEVLGKGAMKTVYKAIDEVAGMEVAWNQVKISDLLQSAEDLQRLHSEVHLLSTLDHNSIMRFYTSWIDVDRRTFNFITEMFTSGTLREYRKKYNQLDNRAIKIWARQILSGLVYLHGHHPLVIHRDIKCDNIFVNGHLGQVKIGDLGLAAILQGSPRAHSVIGTPEFMAPELYTENYNELVDVYSFGMCVLEMLTSEFPYTECANPAQIYMKVTAGELPKAFYKIQDLEAQRFVGKCLVAESKRISASELMLDPFLASDGEKYSSVKPAIVGGCPKPFLNENLRIDELQLTKESPRSKMTITGSLKAQDNTIFLKVKFSDKQGSARNVYFPFDISTDTPLDVAIEMVKDLEIKDWEPFEIAGMIDKEIFSLVPDSKKSFHSQKNHDNFLIYDEENEKHDIRSCSSSTCSSQVPFAGAIAPNQIGDWSRDDVFDDTSSQSSLNSGKYSNLNYSSSEDQRNLIANRQMYPEERSETGPSSKMDGRRLMRNRSLVDLRSQLLHRSLVEEVNRRRLFRTAGALEDVGFRSPMLIGSQSHKSQEPKGRRA